MARRAAQRSTAAAAKIVFSGGTATGARVNSGGTQYVNSGGTAISTTLNTGGTIDVAISRTSAVDRRA